MKEIKGLKTILESFKTRQVKFGGYAALITVALLAGLILVNLIIGQFTFQLDLTENKVYSLSEQTIQILDQIQSPVYFYGLWQPGQENTDVMEVIELYLARSRNLRFQVIDPDRNPGFLLRFDRDRAGISTGSVIVEGEKGFRIINPADMFDVGTFANTTSIMGVSVEKRLTSALLYVETGETPVVYEVSGHLELRLSDLGLQSYLEQENFEVRELNLTQSAVPADASILVIISPRFDLTRIEADRLLDYLEQGGRLLVMADFQIQEIDMLNEVMASYGIRFDYGVVMENDPSYTTGYFYLDEVPDMAEHDITKPLEERRTPAVLSFVMGVSETGTKRRSVGIEPLLFSSGNSWLRTDIFSNSPSRIDSDINGPITIGMAVTDPYYIQEAEAQARIVAIGASTVMSTMYGDISIFDQQFVPGGNTDLFMNSLTWLEDRPETLSVRSKSVFILPMRLSGLQVNIFSGIFVILIPLAFFVSGLVIWLKRRHL